MVYRNQPRKPVDHDKHGKEVRRAKNIRFTAAEWAAIEQVAEGEGQPPCTWVRQVAIAFAQERDFALQVGLRRLGWDDED